MMQTIENNRRKGGKAYKIVSFFLYSCLATIILHAPKQKFFDYWGACPKKRVPLEQSFFLMFFTQK